MLTYLRYKFGNSIILRDSNNKIGMFLFKKFVISS